MPTVTVDAHFSDYDDGTSFSWPAASVACSAGDIILANLGSQLSYTSTDGATTITFGQFWTGSAWSGTGVPYVNVAATTNLEDDNFADIEVLAAIDYYVDAHTGEYPVHQKSGHHAIHGGHARPKSHGRRHAHPHKPERAHFRNGVFQLSGGTAAPVLSLIAHSGNTYWVDDQSGEWQVPTATCITGTAISGSAPFQGQWAIGGAAGCIVLFDVINFSGKSLATQVFYTVAKGTDITTDAYVGYLKVGYISDGVNANGDYIFHGYHEGSHTVTDKHLSTKSVQQQHITPGHVHGNQDGAGFDHIAHGSQSIGTHTVRDKTSSRGHHHKHHHARAHFRNGQFQMSGGTGAPVLSVVSYNGTSTFYVPDDGSGEVSLPSATAISGTGSGSAPFTGGVSGAGFWPPGGAVGAIVLYDYTVNRWGTATVGSDLGTSTFDNWIKVGHVAAATDFNGNYVFHHYFTGSEQITDKHHASNAVNESHIQTGAVHGGESGHKNHVAAGSIAGNAGGFGGDHIVHGSQSIGTHTVRDKTATRGHLHKHHSHRGHFRNGVFSVTGGSGAPQLNAIAFSGSTLFVPDDGTGEIGLPAALAIRDIGSGSPPFTGNTTAATGAGFWPNTGVQGAIVLYDYTNNRWGTARATDDLGSATFDGWFKVGHMSTNLDKQGNYVFHSYFSGSQALQDVHLANGIVGIGKLTNPGSGGVAVTSGQDTWSTTFSGSWVMRNWANVSPPSIGSLTGGNMGSMTVAGSQFQVEVSLRNTIGTWGAYHRVYRMFPQVNASSVPNEAQILSDDTNWEIYVQRFDIMTDGSVACVIGTFGSGTVSIGAQFRIIWAIQS